MIGRGTPGGLVGLLAASMLTASPSSALAASATVEVICLESPCVVIVGQQTLQPAALERRITLPPGKHRVMAWDPPTGMRQLKQVTVHNARHPVRIVYNLLDAHDDHTAPMISHSPCDDFASGEPVTILAIFHDDRDLFEPRVYFRYDADPSWVGVPLVMQTRGMAAFIPARSGAARLSYYIEAFDDLGNGPGELGNAEAPIRLRGRATASDCDQLGAEMVPSLFSVMTVGRSHCSVYVADQLIGTAPLFKKMVPPGEHEVKVTCADGATYVTRVLFEDNASEKLIITPGMLQ